LFLNDNFGSALSPMYKIDKYQSAVDLPFFMDNTLLNIWIYNRYNIFHILTFNMKKKQKESGACFSKCNVCQIKMSIIAGIVIVSSKNWRH